MYSKLRPSFILSVSLLSVLSILSAQGVTTAELSGIISSSDGTPLPGANVVLVHQPSGTQYGAIGREGGNYDILNLKVGGPYSLTASFIGYESQTQTEIYLNLGAGTDINFTMETEAIGLERVEVVAQGNDVLNADRTGAATSVSGEMVNIMPSIKRSTRDLTRLDPRSDGNFSFGGRNWLYNNVSLDGSYFNNSFGLDDPAPGGQAGAEPVSFDAVEQVQVSVAPFDVREGGFTGAGINTVTKSGTNTFSATAYSYMRNEAFVGNKIGDVEVSADPNLAYNQVGMSVSGPIIKDKMFFFANVEIERKEEPGSNFVADDDGTIGVGESRVTVTTMDAISQRMSDEYDYDTGPYQNYSHFTENNKFLAKLDWNLSRSHNLSFRFSMLDAKRDLGPHAFVLSFANSGRGPNSTSLPFRNSGYTINNNLQSYALELNSIFSDKLTNRFFASYNRFRDYREPFSEDFPTIDIGETGVTYTTVGHEPFSIHNILDQDVLQITNNVTYLSGKHVITGGVNFENFNFFNSFNIFRHGVFFLDDELFDIGFILGGSTFESVDEFMAESDPDSSIAFRAAIGSGDFKGELISVRQFSVYGQDKMRLSRALTVTAGLRIDIPIYNTTPVENPFSTGLTLLDENDASETVDQATLAGSSPLFSPRVGFNYDVKGDRSLQIRGGTGIFTGRVPFVWVGNVISNPGQNPNIAGDGSDNQETDSGDGRTYEGKSVLQQSFDLNAMVDDFKWPQVWTTNVAVDAKLPWDILGTFEFLYGKDLNSIYMRNADLDVPVRTLADSRPYYGGFGDASELNYDPFNEGNGVYVLDNSNEGHNMTITTQLQKQFDNGASASVAYTKLSATNSLKSTEIASVLWQNQPVQGDPNNPKLAPAEFGNPHRFIATGSYRFDWSENMSTRFGMFFEFAQGNTYIYSGGNRYSFIYSGDVNGDGAGGNDLIYIPKDANDITLEEYSSTDPFSGATTVHTVADQRSAMEAFINQDDYLSSHRGEIAERFGAINPWFSNLDFRILHDLKLPMKGGLQLSVDILNFGNLINSGWGVRKVASASATSPLRLAKFDDTTLEPVFNFTGPSETYIDDPSIFSRWQIQVGLRYTF